MLLSAVIYLVKETNIYPTLTQRINAYETLQETNHVIIRLPNPPPSRSPSETNQIPVGLELKNKVFYRKKW